MDFTGPFGALLLAVSVLGVAAKVIAELWGEHKRSDQRDRDENDRAWALLEAITPPLKLLADAQAAATRDAEGRHRLEDGK